MTASSSDQIPAHMHAVVTTGNGGYDRLDHRLVPTPVQIIQETDFCGPFVMAGLGAMTSAWQTRPDPRLHAPWRVRVDKERLDGLGLHQGSQEKKSVIGIFVLIPPQEGVAG